MADYSKLINDLHDAAKEIASFYYYKEWIDLIDLLNDAANTIEALSKNLHERSRLKGSPAYVEESNWIPGQTVILMAGF